MDSRSLTPQQIAALQASLGPTIRYLRRLLARMDARGFPANDPARIRALLALDTMQQLFATLAQIEIDRRFMLGTEAKSKREWERRRRDQRNG